MVDLSGISNAAGGAAGAAGSFSWSDTLGQLGAKLGAVAIDVGGFYAKNRIADQFDGGGSAAPIISPPPVVQPAPVQRVEPAKADPRPAPSAESGYPKWLPWAGLAVGVAGLAYAMRGKAA